MQPRNQRSEFVGSRLRKLAGAVAGREPDAILTGLQGHSAHDEIAGNAPNCRTATGPAGPGPTDNPLAWCALRGTAQFPFAARLKGAAVTSGHLSSRRTEAFYVPIWRGSLRPARLRSILASRQLLVLSGKGFEGSVATDLEMMEARAWLDSRGVDGVIRFPVRKFGSDNAPERRAMRGEPIPVREVA
jgi:CRISPR-associated protein Csb3